jgi:hypothetical protein
MDSILTFLNLEYIYLTIYDCILSTCRFSGDLSFLDKIRPYAIVAALLLFAGIIYVAVRVRQIRREEREEFDEIIVAKGMGEKKREKWDRLVDLVSSENESDWRLAILEADTILDDMVDVMGYKGEGLGEKLKQIERSDFNTLDKAWDAHKVRNQIAHAGSDHVLTKREVRRVIDLYKQVFDEFEFI